ncbi:MAG TPA: O-antigen ligase family protein [Thermoanaerobaculia bacterium]|nr:O-antigen ligase family protein [Thermoanaerobaculia bacterium]
MTQSQAEWSARIERWREQTLLMLVLAGAFAIPLVFVRDPIDMFRLPKALFLRAEAIMIVTATIAAWILGAPLPRLKPRDPRLLTLLGVFGGLIVLTITSTNRALSMESLATAAATAIVFFATVSAARRHGPILLAVSLVAATANAVLAVLEETDIWMPFGVQSTLPHHLQSTALAGNPNEIGGYLGAATLACIAAISMRRSRWFLACAAPLALALVASQTLTALIAFPVACIAMIAVTSWKKAITAAAAAVAIGVVAFTLIAPLRERAVNIERWLRAGEYNTIFTERLTAFVAAWSMFTDHPVTGVGPGAFAWQYYDYKIRAEERFPSLRNAYNRGVNFGEVHNDHLQVLAETGIGGYGVCLALLAALASISFRRTRDGPESRLLFGQRLAFPLAVFWFVLSLAQFPLETTIVRSMLFHLSALCVGWRST